LEIGLKWPNDIYSLDKKLGGILIEASTTADNCCVAVIGLGLNVYLPQSASNSITRPWTDLTTILGQNKVHRNALAAALLNNLLPVIAQFANDGIESYIKEWSGYDCMTGKQATLFYGRQSLTGIIEGVDNKGQLLLRQTNGEVSAYASGEVSFNEVI
jgi:BirA family biotin operon repressor/biotin-[acetyl-CoA-carboxylase] ligase